MTISHKPNLVELIAEIPGAGDICRPKTRQEMCMLRKIRGSEAPFKRLNQDDILRQSSLTKYKIICTATQSKLKIRQLPPQLTRIMNESLIH